MERNLLQTVLHSVLQKRRSTTAYVAFRLRIMTNTYSISVKFCEAKELPTLLLVPHPKLQTKWPLL